jgi:hypothetical protein
LRSWWEADTSRGPVVELVGIARFTFNEGKLDEFKRLSAQAMEIVRTKDSERCSTRYETM